MEEKIIASALKSGRVRTKRLEDNAIAITAERTNYDRFIEATFNREITVLLTGDGSQKKDELKITDGRTREYRGRWPHMNPYLYVTDQNALNRWNGFKLTQNKCDSLSLKTYEGPPCDWMHERYPEAPTYDLEFEGKKVVISKPQVENALQNLKDLPQKIQAIEFSRKLEQQNLSFEEQKKVWLDNVDFLISLAAQLPGASVHHPSIQSWSIDKSTENLSKLLDNIIFPLEKWAIILSEVAWKDGNLRENPVLPLPIIKPMLHPVPRNPGLLSNEDMNFLDALITCVSFANDPKIAAMYTKPDKIVEFLYKSNNPPLRYNNNERWDRYYSALVALENYFTNCIPDKQVYQTLEYEFTEENNLKVASLNLAVEDLKKFKELAVSFLLYCPVYVEINAREISAFELCVAYHSIAFRIDDTLLKIAEEINSGFHAHSNLPLQAADVNSNNVNNSIAFRMDDALSKTAEETNTVLQAHSNLPSQVAVINSNNVNSTSIESLLYITTGGSGTAACVVGFLGSTQLSLFFIAVSVVCLIALLYLAFDLNTARTENVLTL